MTEDQPPWSLPSPYLNNGYPLVSPVSRSSLFSPILSPSISADSYSISPIPLSPGFQSFLLSAPSTASPPDEFSSPSPFSIGESVAVVADCPASQPRKRRRLTEAQLRGRRQKQRHADLQRREREHTALSRLHELLTANGERKQRVDDEAKEEDKAKTRADLLEESVDCINQLQLLVAQLTSACNQYQSNDRGLPAKRSLTQSILASSSTADIDNLPPSASSFVAAHIRRLSLSSSMFTRSPVCVVIMHVPSGVIADASDSYLCHTGWQRSHLVGRRMFPPLETMVQEPMHLTNPHSDIMRDNRTLVQAEGGRVVHSRQEPQYESSLLLAQQLLTGEKDVILAVWRGQLGDGRVYESHVHSWVSEWAYSEQGGVRYPLYTLSVHSTTGSVCVGETRSVVASGNG